MFGTAETQLSAVRVRRADAEVRVHVQPVLDRSQLQSAVLLAKSLQHSHSDNWQRPAVRQRHDLHLWAAIGRTDDYCGVHVAGGLWVAMARLPRPPVCPVTFTSISIVAREYQCHIHLSRSSIFLLWTTVFSEYRCHVHSSFYCGLSVSVSHSPIFVLWSVSICGTFLICSSSIGVTFTYLFIVICEYLYHVQTSVSHVLSVSISHLPIFVLWFISICITFSHFSMVFFQYQYNTSDLCIVICKYLYHVQWSFYCGLSV